jgi:ribosomal protein S18 acetylase RimI-like enzyme
VPANGQLERLMEGFDWRSRSLVVERDGAVQAVGLVTARDTVDGLVARTEVAARDDGDRVALLRWGLGLGRAAGARFGQVWRPAGGGQGMDDLGLEPVRPFWRMDRPHLDGLPAPRLPEAYQLAVGPPWRVAAETYNRAFGEHWRFSPMPLEPPPEAPRSRDLQLLSVNTAGRPAAVVLCEVEQRDPGLDLRSQPVGVVSVVGTVPEHRRRGLGAALTAEGLRRLREHGAASASLYVDGLNPTRAYDLYRRLGFAVGFEYEVYEACW